jgi:hypothetical protein
MQRQFSERCRSGGTGRHTELVPPRSASPSEFRPAEEVEVVLRGRPGSGAACDSGAAHGGAVLACPRCRPPGLTRPHADPDRSLGDLAPQWVRVRTPPSAAGAWIAARGLPFGARLHPPGRAPPRTGDGLAGTQRRSTPPDREPRLLFLGRLIRTQASALRFPSRPVQSTPSARSFAIASASRPSSLSTSLSCSPSRGARREIRHGVFSKR